MKQLGVPFKKVDRSATPGVLRGSGATYLYLETEGLAREVGPAKDCGILFAGGGRAGDFAETP